MSTLAVTNVTFDKSEYNPGDVIYMTVTYTTDDMPAPSTTYSVTANAADVDGTAAQSASYTVAGKTGPLPVQVTATDTRNSTWTVTSSRITGTGPWTGTVTLTTVA